MGLNDPTRPCQPGQQHESSWTTRNGVRFSHTSTMGSDGKLTWERTSGKGNVARVTGNALPRTHGALLYENSGSPDVSRAIDALAKHASNKGQFAQIHWNDHVVEVAPAPKGNVQAQKINADAADRVFWREVNLRR